MHRTEYNDIKVNLIKKSLDQKEQEVIVPEERRKGEDGILQFINLMCIWLWGILLIILAIIAKAGKNINYITQNKLLWAPSEFWAVDLLKTALIATAICIVFCTITIILSFTRHRRRSDRINRSLVICEILSFIIGLFLIIKLLH